MQENVLAAANLSKKLYSGIMGIPQVRLAPYLDDYFQVTGSKTEYFICPITLQVCKNSDLIYGHILNKKLIRASRRKIVQFSKVDNFYGTRLEPGLVRFLNLGHEDELGLLKESGELQVKLTDGRLVTAFMAGSRSARKAHGRFPHVELLKDGKPFASVYLRMPFADPFLVSQLDITASFAL